MFLPLRHTLVSKSKIHNSELNMKNPVPLNLTKILSFAILLGVALVLSLADRNLSEDDTVKPKKKSGIPGSMKAMDLWSDMRTYPSKIMDASSFSSSFQKASRMGLTAQSMSMLGVYATTTTPWTELAPKNFAGRILSIAFHPTIANTMWVGSASGGLWKTTTGGTGAPGGINWQFVPTGFPVLGVSSIVVNPLNANEIYAGTGEVYSYNPAGTGGTGAGHVRTFRGSYGIGIIKSIDGGATWTKTLHFDSSALKGVMDMVIHPTTPSTVFAATTDGLYRTTNSGTTWTLIHSSILVMDLCFKPGDPNVLYVSSGNFLSAGRGIYKTVNANAASPTFTAINTGLPATISGKVMLAISANDPSKIYASVGKDPNTTHTQGLYVSTNEGASWASVGTNMLGTQGWYGHDVAVSQTDANRILWAELNTYVSTNGGVNKTNTGIWSEWDVNNVTVGDITEGQNDAVVTDYVHADVHRIIASPHDATGNTFFLCTDGGLFRTTNGGNNFNTLNGGLNTAQIYSNIAIHPTNPNYMLIGLQDNEAMVYEGNPGCRRIGGLGDGFHTAMNSAGTIQLVESYYFNWRRSTNSGGSWVSSPTGAVPEVACFNVPMVWSKTALSNYVFAGTVYFKRSTDAGANWSDLNGGSPIAGANNPCIAMAAPTNSIVYFSTAPASGIRSKMWKTTNGTAASPTFTEITGTLPDRYYSKIAVDPSDPNRLAVTLSGFGSSHVFLSADGGTTWCDIGGGLPNLPHNTVMFDPNNSATIYVGNDIGIFYANNVPTGALGSSQALTWTAYNEGFTDAIMVSDIAVTSTNKLRMASYGRGLWERDLAPTSNLPVSFKEFEVAVTSLGNQLKWTLSYQTNVARYEVEYSTDGLNFYKVGSVPAKSGPGDLTYTYLHAIQNNVNGFYRIKNIDIDDSYTYSSVEMVNANKIVSKLTVYPNPTTGMFKVKLPTSVNESVKLIIYDNSGRLVMLKNVKVQQGTAIPVDITKVSRGTYQVVCEGEKTRWTATVIKK